MIRAPFNFVPLSEKVFFPDWADSVSHDIPFEDSQSGSIDITITAKSPIFIRDHEKKEEFCQYIYPNGEKQYYIPATSVKGMVRNVLEIMSFSKMSIYNDDTYAVRDLRNRDLYMSQMTPDNIFCGWLKKTDDGYIIEDCGKPGRIKHEEIDKIVNVNFAKNFKEYQFKNDLKNKSKNPTNEFIKTAKYKYGLLKGKNLVENFKQLPANNKVDKREIYVQDSSGKIGKIVLTGQASGRKDKGKLDAKIYEFIFFKKISTLDIETKVFKKFKFAYFDGESNASEDWKWRKKQLDNKEKIPVFFQKDADGNVKHLGLSYLYKLPYKHSVKDGVYNSHDNEKLDLSETIFGCINEKNSLKGRVQFSHFKVDGKAEEDVEKNEILGTPRASYYPIYVKQNPNNLFTTFMDDDFSIAGWKRYPIQCGTRSYPAPTDKHGNVNKKVATTFTPLKSGVVFKGKLRYHNLKKSELGALLSALTFHNTDECYHNIGMAKPLGYGKIKLEVKNIEVKEYLKAFELKINEQIENWHNQKQLLELLTMATEQKDVDTKIWKYMSLTQFTDHKKRGQEDYLYPYSEFDKISRTTVKTLLSYDELKSLKQIQEELKEQLRLEEERREAEELLKAEEEKESLEKEKMERLEREKEEAKIELFNNKLEGILDELEKEEANLQVVQNFIEKYPNYEKVEEIKLKKDRIEKVRKDNKHNEVNEKFNTAYEDFKKKKSNQRNKDKFIKKWSKKQENGGSEYILEIIEKLK